MVQMKMKKWLSGVTAGVVLVSGMAFSGIGGGGYIK